VDRVTPSGDDLSRTLDAIRVRSVVYCRSELGAPWALRVRSSTQAKFHLLLKGSAVLTLDNGEAASLEPGDLAVLPHGSGHTVGDKAGSRARRLDRVIEDNPVDSSGTMRYGGRGPAALLVCGGFDTTPSGLSWLPPLLVVGAADNGLGRWLDPMLDLVRGQHSYAPGDAAVMAKVADVFLADILRHYVATSNGASLDLSDPPTEDTAIAEVVALMHAHSSEHWTLASLARMAGMSRSSFTGRFQAAIGAAPITYLTQLRLARAAGNLAASTRPLGEIARAAGYDNESSFSKAFTRHYGHPPGAYRRLHRRGRQ
jgi:AraC-like DNA-binding protein